MSTSRLRTPPAVVLFACLVALPFAPLPALAQSTPDDAFQAGQQAGRSGMNAAAGAVSTQSGQQNLPYYGTSAPQSGLYGNGQGAIGAAGSQKQIDCQTAQSGDAFNQQECDAVNFMTRNPTDRQKFKIDGTKDPLMTGSKSIIANPGPQAGTSTQQCHIETTKVPGKTTTETCTETETLGPQSCQRVLSVNVQMSCRPGELFQSLDLPRNTVDHIWIYAKCDPQAQDNSYIEMTADAFGIKGGTVRNATVKIPKDLASIPTNAWATTQGGQQGYLLVMTHPHWENNYRDVPVYILKDSTGCKAGSTDCAYHFYWEWVDTHQVCTDNGDGTDCSWLPYVRDSNNGWATGLIEVTTITDQWDNQCLYLDSRSQ